MICKKCTKNDVCRLAEHCTKLEEHYKGMEIDDAFTVKVDCKHYSPITLTGYRPVVPPQPYTPPVSPHPVTFRRDKQTALDSPSYK